MVLTLNWMNTTSFNSSYPSSRLGIYRNLPYLSSAWWFESHMFWHKFNFPSRLRKCRALNTDLTMFLFPSYPDWPKKMTNMFTKCHKTYEHVNIFYFFFKNYYCLVKNSWHVLNDWVSIFSIPCYLGFAALGGDLVQDADRCLLETFHQKPRDADPVAGRKGWYAIAWKKRCLLPKYVCLFHCWIFFMCFFKCFFFLGGVMQC